jgi:hypothetical protein
LQRFDVFSTVRVHNSLKRRAALAARRDFRHEICTRLGEANRRRLRPDVSHPEPVWSACDLRAVGQLAVQDPPLQEMQPIPFGQREDRLFRKPELLAARLGTERTNTSVVDNAPIPVFGRVARRLAMGAATP